MPRRNQKQLLDLHKPKIQVARQKMKIHDILPGEVEAFDAIVRNARKKLVCCVTQENTSLPPSQKHRKLKCHTQRGETLALSEGRLSLTERDRQIQVFEFQMCIIRMEITLQIKGTHSCADQQSHEHCISKDYKGRMIGRNLLWPKDWRKVPSLECLYV